MFYYTQQKAKELKKYIYIYVIPGTSLLGGVSVQLSNGGWVIVV